jgi:16S rRNA (uracil1498-N3)-methyltransferase
MARRRFYVPQDSIREGIAVLPSSQAHHLRNVLRLGTGEMVEIFDGKGRGYTGTVDVRGSEVVVRDLQTLPSKESSIQLKLAPALIKTAKFEWMLQKGTELGVNEFIPIKAKFSDVQITENKIASRLERWDRIVKEASKQCHRFSIPKVHAPVTLLDFLKSEEFSSCTKVLFYEKESEPWILDPSVLENGVVLCIGPEGGWEESEVEQARDAGCKIFSLGPWILRAETAAIAAVSILQHQINLLTIHP